MICVVTINYYCQIWGEKKISLNKYNDNGFFFLANLFFPLEKVWLFFFRLFFIPGKKNSQEKWEKNGRYFFRIPGEFFIYFFFLVNFFFISRQKLDFSQKCFNLPGHDLLLFSSEIFFPAEFLFLIFHKIRLFFLPGHYFVFLFFQLNYDVSRRLFF